MSSSVIEHSDELSFNIPLKSRTDMDPAPTLVPASFVCSSKCECENKAENWNTCVSCNYQTCDFSGADEGWEYDDGTETWLCADCLHTDCSDDDCSDNGDDESVVYICDGKHCGLSLPRENLNVHSEGLMLCDDCNGDRSNRTDCSCDLCEIMNASDDELDA